MVAAKQLATMNEWMKEWMNDEWMNEWINIKQTCSITICANILNA